MIIETAGVAFAILICAYLLILKSAPPMDDIKNAAAKEDAGSATTTDTMKQPQAPQNAPHIEKDLHSEGHGHNAPGRTKYISIDEEEAPSKSHTMSELASLFGLEALSKPLEKELSVVRIDISNISELKEKLSPESFFRVMDVFYSQLITAAETFQGEINHFDGNWALMAFGRILILDDHRQSAINAAHAVPVLVHEIEELYPQDGAELSPFVPVEVKVAAASGKVIAGPLGKDIRQVFSLFGGPVNTVEELIKNAEPFKVVTDEPS